MTKLLITGASGRLGRRVLELLLATESASSIIATTRTPEKLSDLGVTVRKSSFDDDVDALTRAYEGADHLLIISTNAVGRRVEQHRKALRAAAQAGVEHVTYTSLARTEPGNPVAVAPEHWATEQALAEAGVGYTVLRNNWYAEYVLPSLQTAARTGQLFGATNNQAFAPVTRDDCARAAAASLKRGGTQKRTLEISGSASVTHEQLAALVGELVNRQVQHIDVPAAQYEKALAQHVAKDVAHLHRTFHDAIAQGYLNPPSDTETLIGTKPVSIARYLATPEVRATLSS